MCDAADASVAAADGDDSDKDDAKAVTEKKTSYGRNDSRLLAYFLLSLHIEL